MIIEISFEIWEKKWGIL